MCDQSQCVDPNALNQEYGGEVGVHILADFPLSPEEEKAIDWVIRAALARVKRRQREQALEKSLPPEHSEVKLDSSSLGALIRLARLRKGLSPIRVATAMRVDLGYYALLELGKAPYSPHDKSLKVLVDLLDLEEEELKRLKRALAEQRELYDPFHEVDYFDDLANHE